MSDVDFCQLVWPSLCPTVPHSELMNDTSFGIRSLLYAARFPGGDIRKS